jgi:hypothetical protein
MQVAEKEMNMNIQMEVPAATLSDHAGYSKTCQYEQSKTTHIHCSTLKKHGRKDI